MGQRPSENEEPRPWERKSFDTFLPSFPINPEFITRGIEVEVFSLGFKGEKKKG